LSSTRLNNPKEAAVIVVMQRLSAEDVTGRILDSDSSGDWRHYCVPMEWEAARCCQTGWQTDVGPVSWTDPRGLDDEGEPLLIFPDRMPRDDAAEAILQEREGALMWPERFGAEEIARLKASLGPFMSSGRLQQSPQPRGGELFRSAWWCVWESRDNKFPHVDFVVAAVDGAYTEDKLNDPSAMSVWGTFRHPELRAKRIICLDAWRKHVPIHGNATPRTAQETLLPGDTWQEVEMKNALYKQRAGREWGLVEWIRATCQRFSVDVLLIEKAATGISVAQEIQRLYFNDGIPVHLIPPRGDKVSRALAIQPLLANGLIYAPKKSWADDLLIKEMSEFPLGRFDDLTDTASMALGYMRRTGRIHLDEETRAALADNVRHHSPRKILYPV
jgi:predicted phage terminase large subunit-like protein